MTQKGNGNEYFKTFSSIYGVRPVFRMSANLTILYHMIYGSPFYVIVHKCYRPLKLVRCFAHRVYGALYFV